MHYWFGEKNVNFSKDTSHGGMIRRMEDPAAVREGEVGGLGDGIAGDSSAHPQS